MDIFDQSGHPAHAYDPGISSNGIVWLTKLPDNAVEINLGAGRASMRAVDLPAFDWVSVKNSLLGGTVLGPPSSGTVSFDIEWSGIIRRNHIDNDEQGFGFAGEFLVTGATVEWSSKTFDSHGNVIFSFTSDGRSAGNLTQFAEIGHERNGTFLPG